MYQPQNYKTSPSLILLYFYLLSNPKTFLLLFWGFFSVVLSNCFGKLWVPLIFASEDFNNKNDLDGQTQRNKVASAIMALKIPLRGSQKSQRKGQFVFSVSFRKACLARFLALAETKRVVETNVPQKDSHGRRSWPGQW